MFPVPNTTHDLLPPFGRVRVTDTDARWIHIEPIDPPDGYDAPDRIRAKHWANKLSPDYLSNGLRMIGPDWADDQVARLKVAVHGLADRSELAWPDIVAVLGTILQAKERSVSELVVALADIEMWRAAIDGIRAQVAAEHRAESRLDPDLLAPPQLGQARPNLNTAPDMARHGRITHIAALGATPPDLG